jgi:RNA polymerase sigma-70 factor (ECF subfamily)
MATSHVAADGCVDQRHWVLAAVDRFEGPLTLYATRLLGESDRARDVVQDTFLKLCKQEQAELQDRLAEWLFTVCRNRALDVLRKERRMHPLNDDHAAGFAAAEPDPAEAFTQADAARQAIELLETLPVNQREVIRLKFQHGFSYREISRISGHSVSNVGFLIHTGLKTLRRRLAGRLPAEA